MPEPVTIAALALAAAQGAMRALGDKSVGATARAALSKRQLSKALECAFAEATSAFLSVWDENDLSEQARANLKIMVSAAAWHDALSQLPRPQPLSIETEKCRELFDALAPRESTQKDFDIGWRLLIERFERAVAESPCEPLRSYLELIATEVHTEQSHQHLRALEEVRDKLPDSDPAESVRPDLPVLERPPRPNPFVRQRQYDEIRGRLVAVAGTPKPVGITFRAKQRGSPRGAWSVSRPTLRPRSAAGSPFQSSRGPL